MTSLLLFFAGGLTGLLIAELVTWLAVLSGSRK